MKLFRNLAVGAVTITTFAFAFAPSAFALQNPTTGQPGAPTNTCGPGNPVTPGNAAGPQTQLTVGMLNGTDATNRSYTAVLDPDSGLITNRSTVFPTTASAVHG